MKNIMVISYPFIRVKKDTTGCVTISIEPSNANDLIAFETLFTKIKGEGMSKLLSGDVQLIFDSEELNEE